MEEGKSFKMRLKKPFFPFSICCISLTRNISSHCKTKFFMQDAPMRFFYRVRTNEPSIEEELPEVPLRRSPVLSERQTLTDPTDATIPISTEKPTTHLPVVASPAASVAVPMLVPGQPETPVVVVPQSCEPHAAIAKVKCATMHTVSPPTTPKSVSFSDTATGKEGRANKVKTPKNDDKLAKQAARSAKKLTKDAAAAAAAAAMATPKDSPTEKRVENIKLKIDQNSVTIIKSSTKELKLKFKKERDAKELHSKTTAVASTSSPSSSSSSRANKTTPIAAIAEPSSKHSGRKSDIASIKLAKVQTPERSPDAAVKYEIKSPVFETPPPLPTFATVPPAVASVIVVPPPLPTPVIEVNLDSVKTEVDEHEEKKFEFLNAFNLLPTKSLTPTKLLQIDAQIRQQQQHQLQLQLSPKSYLANGSSPTSSPATKRTSPTPPGKKSPPLKALVVKANKDVFKVPLPMPVPRCKPSDSDASLKRKQKEALKPQPKRARISSPELPTAPIETSSTKRNSPINKQLTGLPEISVIASPPVASGRKSVSPPLKRKEAAAPPQPMRPPNEHRPITAKDVLPKPPQVPIRNYDLVNPSSSSNEKKNLSVKPIDKLMPKPPIVNNVQRPHQSDTPRPSSAACKTVQTAGSWPSSAGSGAPKKLPNLLPKPSSAQSSTSSTSSTASSSMGPPLHPISNLSALRDTEIKQIRNDGSNKDIKVYGPAMDKFPLAIKAPGSSSPAYVPSYPSLPVPLKPHGNSSGGYLNYALMNSHKRAADAAAVGNRTPAAYAGGGSTPAYTPNSPQYTSNYGGSSSSGNVSYAPLKYMKAPAHLANMFPHPPIQVASPSMATNKPAPAVSGKQSFKRPSPVAQQQLTDRLANCSPPEKQQKVQSLLDSCNISFPSSLSITLHDQKDTAAGGSMFQSLHKGPVNNYIEIVKLPDVPLAADEHRKPPSPPINQPTSPHSPAQSIALTTGAANNILNYVSVTTSAMATGSSSMATISNIAHKTATSSTPANKIGSAALPATTVKGRPSPDKKTLPELNPIDKLAALNEHVSFQEKFIKSLDDQPKKAVPGGAKTVSGTAKLKAAPRAIAPKSTSPPNVAALQQQQQRVIGSTQGNYHTTKSSPAQRGQLKSKSPPVSTATVSGRSSSGPSSSARITKPDPTTALDLTAAIGRHPLNHNNNEQLLKRKSPYPSGISNPVADLTAVAAAQQMMQQHQQKQLQQHHQQQLQQQQQSNQASNDMAVLFAAAMARASAQSATVSPYMMATPPVITPYSTLHQQIHQQYILDALKMNYNKAMAAAIAGNAAPAQQSTTGGNKTPQSSPKSQTSPKSSSA